jgi:hypothetical protein
MPAAHSCAAQQAADRARAALPPPAFLDCAPHQLRDHGALVLVGERCVEGVPNLIRDAVVDRRHAAPRLLRFSTNLAWATSAVKFVVPGGGLHPCLPPGHGMPPS